MKSRIIYYYQTFVDIDNLLTKNTPITHIHLSSIHFGTNFSKQPYIHLNDFTPDSHYFDKMWINIKKAYDLGIKIILMVGGAGLAFNNLFSNFEAYYKLLFDLIKSRPYICGIDLDIEEEVSLNNVKYLINRINKDFGSDFIITMAPIQNSLQTDNEGLGGFSYKELYKSNEGKRINYFNGQFYSDFSIQSYKDAVNNGYPPSKVVMGMDSNQFSSTNFNDALNIIKNLKSIYNDFGGVFVWELFNCPPNPKYHGTWSKKISGVLNQNFCLIQ